jgi:MFS family permease
MAHDLAPGQKGTFLAQFVISMPSLAVVLTAPLIGWAAERIGFRRMLLLGAAGFVVTGIMGYAFPQFLPLVASRFLSGVSGAALVTAAFALINYYYDAQLRDRMFGFLSGVVAALSVGAGGAGGLIVVHFGWPSVFLLQTYVLLPLIAAVPLTATAASFKAAPKEAEAAISSKALMMSMAVVLALIIWINIMALTVSLQLPFVMRGRGLGDPRMVSLIVMTVSASMFFTSFAYGWLAARLGVMGVLTLMVMLMGVSHLLMGTSESMPGLIVGAVFQGMAAAFIKPVAATFVFENVPEPIQGRATGVFVSAIFLGSFLHPFVLAPFTATFGIAPCILAMGFINMALAMALAVVTYRSRFRAATPEPAV